MEFITLTIVLQYYQQLNFFNTKQSPEIKQNLKQKYSLEGYKFIDLFAGIGGIRIPFDRLGAKCVFTSEWDKYSQLTYEANFGDKPYGDITKIEASEIPNFDILLAGFPCQPFSVAGLRKGFEDTRGTLFFDICKIIDFHKPAVIFLENVKGFKNHNQGQTFSIVKQSLEQLGYIVYAQVLNARDFGVPQNRDRIYIICFQKCGYYIIICSQNTMKHFKFYFCYTL